MAEKTLRAVAKKLDGADTTTWAAEIAREICSTGALEALLNDEDISEIFVNGPHQIIVRREDALTPVEGFFSSEEAVALAVRRLMSEAGQRFDATCPVAEVRLRNGMRVNAVHHANSVRGPLVTITRSSQQQLTLEQLVFDGVLSESMAEFLRICVRNRRNVMVGGGVGSGVATLMGALGAELPANERIVTVQRVARLELPQSHIVTLEPRFSLENNGELGMRELVSNALRMRPDRLLVHELEGAEAFELLVAMGGAQDGALISSYGSNIRDGLDRLESLMQMDGQKLPARVVRELIAGGLDVIVQMTRFQNGSVRVTEIVEVVGAEVDLITTQELFTFSREGFDGNGEVQGRFASNGTPPRFYEELQRRGEDLDMAIFRDG